MKDQRKGKQCSKCGITMGSKSRKGTCDPKLCDKCGRSKKLKEWADKQWGHLKN